MKFLPLLLFFFLFCCLPLQAQTQQQWNILMHPEWTGEQTPIEFESQQIGFIETFKGFHHNSQYPTLPGWSYRIPVSGPGNIQVQAAQVEWTSMKREAHEDDQWLKEDLSFRTSIVQDRDQYVAYIYCIPMRKIGNNYEKCLHANLTVTFIPISETQVQQHQQQVQFRGGNGPIESVLNASEVYKIEVTNTGMTRLDQGFLKDQLGINLSGVSMKNIHLYGIGGGMVPQSLKNPRIDDLAEIPLEAFGEADGNMDAGDYFNFYAEGPNIWKINAAGNNLIWEQNVFDTKNYYFLVINNIPGKRITIKNNSINPEYNTAQADIWQHVEEDKVNLLDYNLSSIGTGQRWFGERMSFEKKNISYSSLTNIPDPVIGTPVFMKAVLGCRTPFSTSAQLTITVGSSVSSPVTCETVNFENPSEAVYAKIIELNYSFPQPSGNVPLSLNLNGTSNSLAWVDYVELRSRRNLIMQGTSMDFTDLNMQGKNGTQFNIQSTVDLHIWDITQPVQPIQLATNVNGNTIQCIADNAGALRRFIAYVPNTVFPAPNRGEKINAQNIHGIPEAALYIIYHKEFKEAAEQLANHRKGQNNIPVELVDVDLLYNEFAGGRKEPTAIRDFAKYCYENYPAFKYLCLIGNGTFDYRNLLKASDPKNFIPVYETLESLDPIEGYPSDDFYALVNNGEGPALDGALDIAVGRLPADSPEEAKYMVEKIIRYETDPKMKGDWKLRMVYLSDNGDGNTHLHQNESLAKSNEKVNNTFNQYKLYLDAFPLISTSGGVRTPDINKGINNEMFKGMLMLNYFGHGGLNGLAQERVLGDDEVNTWKNENKLPVFVTATCSFTGHDSPKSKSLGEKIITKEKGGAVGIISTVRSVYSGLNGRLADALFDSVMNADNWMRYPLGEIMRKAKNANGSDTTDSNPRKFALFGDPSMFLGIPRWKVIIETLNGNQVGGGNTDTLKALQKITCSGYIQDASGQLAQNYQGTLYPTLFDKPLLLKTLGQMAGSDRVEYLLQKNILFKGKVSVVNGRWSFTFILPKDINYDLGKAKFSFYSDNGKEEAAGVFNDFYIGGSSTIGLDDQKGPEVKVYINSTNWASGGITHDQPVLIATLADESGINVTGNSIGHDPICLLNEDTKTTVLLNDYFTSDLDQYKSGRIEYPLGKMSPGRYTIKVKAWDITNLEGSGQTDFVIAKDGFDALTHVLNYPNPFTTSTRFQFEHALPSSQLRLSVQIYGINGQLMKTIVKDVQGLGSLINDIAWDGRDDYGNILARGVYIYKIKLISLDSTSPGSAESGFEKLVLLK